MKEIIDLSDDALPTTTDGKDTYIHGAAKYCQLGTPAWSGIFDGIINGTDLNGIPGMIFLDLWPRVGETLNAFLKLRRLYSTLNFYYIGFSESQVEANWLLKSTIDELVEAIDEGSFTLPGKKFEAKMCDEELDPLPAAPNMNVCCMNAAKSKLILPAAVIKQWQANESFGRQFSQWVDDFLTNPLHEIGTEAAADPGQPNADETPNGNKRGCGSKADGETPEKRRNLRLAANIVDPSAIKEVLIKDCKLAKGKEAAHLQIRANHTVYYVNPSLQEITVNRAMIAGFGSGGFKMLRADGSDTPEKSVPFVLKSSSDYICFNNAIVDLGQVVQQQRTKNPTANICYHSMVHDPNDSKQFTLTNTHKVAFIPRDDGADKEKEGDNKSPTGGNIAVFEDVKTWESESMSIIWICRWTTKGLMPVKPAVYLRGELVVPPGRAALLSKHVPAAS
jgi:hypothetical protein